MIQTLIQNKLHSNNEYWSSVLCFSILSTAKDLFLMPNATTLNSGSHFGLLTQKFSTNFPCKELLYAPKLTSRSLSSEEPVFLLSPSHYSLSGVLHTHNYFQISQACLFTMFFGSAVTNNFSHFPRVRFLRDTIHELLLHCRWGGWLILL